MNGRQIVLGRLDGREAAALIEDGQLADLRLDHGALTALPPGAVCRAVVDRLVKGQGGVFLRLPEGERGYLREARGLAEGDVLIVQVAGVAEPGKAIPVTTRVLFRGQAAIATPGAPGVNVSRRIRDEDARARLEALGQAALAEAAADPGMGLVMRSAAQGIADEAIAEELAELLALAAQVMADRAGRPELLVDADLPWRAAWIDWADPPPDSVDEAHEALDAHGVTDAIRALMDPELPLAGGGSAVIETTRALVAIDVNTGRDTSPAAALKANIALARDLPRQLRLRGLGGQVVVDFAPIPKRDRGTLEQVLRAALKRDGGDMTAVGWTALGLYELTRKRDRAPLTMLLDVEP